MVFIKIQWIALQDVCSQIWATLYDYPCLQSCEGLVKYIKDSVRLAWSLVNQVSYKYLKFVVKCKIL